MGIDMNKEIVYDVIAAVGIVGFPVFALLVSQLF